MTKTTANPRVAETGRDAVASQDRRDGLLSGFLLSGLLGRVSTKARWVVSAAIGLITPAALIAESAAAPIAEAMACFGNGSIMALAANANAFMMVP